MADILEQGYPVFFEFGDLSKADLIVLDAKQRPWKVQVKTMTETNGSIELSLWKSGPGYKFKYTAADVDIFAVYVRNRNVVLYVPSSLALKNNRSMTFRFTTPKNGASTCNWWEDFLSPGGVANAGFATGL